MPLQKKVQMNTHAWFAIVAMVAILLMLILYTFLKKEQFDFVVVSPHPCQPGQPCAVPWTLPWWAWGTSTADQNVNIESDPTPDPEPISDPKPDPIPDESNDASRGTTPTAPNSEVPSNESVSAASCGQGITYLSGVKINKDWSKWKYEIKDKKLHLNGQPVNIKGINWYGFEEKSMIVEMLYATTMDDIFKLLAEDKINALRVPVSAEFMQHFCDSNGKLGEKGVIIRIPKDKPNSTEPVKYTIENQQEVAAPSEKNIVKYSGIMKEPELIGKPPVVALDKFLKLAYKYNMLVMFDLHTMNATPPWNDNVMSAGWKLEVPEANRAKLFNKLSPPDMTESKPNSKKISDFYYPNPQVVFFQSYPYRDISQKKLLNFSEDDIVNLWKSFSKFCLDYPHVFAMDLKNEPHSKETAPADEPWQGLMSEVHGPGFKITWDNWSDACVKMGKGVLEGNPNVLIVVEGLDDVQDSTNWGSGFSTMGEANAQKLEAAFGNKLIMSPHQYGTLAGKYDETTGKMKIGTADFEKNWGFLSEKYCVMMGEWALSQKNGEVTPAEAKFMDELATYMKTHSPDAFYFAVNWSSSDTVGLFSKEGVVEKDPRVQKLMATVQPNPTNLAFPT